MVRVCKIFSITVLLTTGLLLNNTAAQAQAPSASQVLTLDEALNETLKNNPAIRQASLGVSIAESKWHETDAVFLPQAGLSYTASITNNPLNAFGFRLQQKQIKAADFNPELLNNPSATADFLTRVDIRQPLINADQWLMRKSAQKQTELYQLLSERSREYLVYEVKKAYAGLQLALDAEQVVRQALETAKAMYKFTSDRVDQGLLQQSDALNARVQVLGLEARMATAGSAVQNASDYLSVLMNRPAGTRYEVPASADVSSDWQTGDTAVSLQRADLAATQKAIESIDLAIRSGKKSFLPRVNAFASYQLNDNSLLGFGANAYLAGVQLSWDIFRGNSARQQIKTRELEKSRLQSELEGRQKQAQAELNAARRQLADAQLAINRQQLAVESAGESLRILQNRYEQGLVTSTDVLMAQTRLAQEKLSLAEARFNESNSRALLEYLTTTSTQ